MKAQPSRPTGGHLSGVTPSSDLPTGSAETSVETGSQLPPTHQVLHPPCPSTGVEPEGIPSNHFRATSWEPGPKRWCSQDLNLSPAPTCTGPACRDLSAWALAAAALRNGLGVLPGIHGDQSQAMPAESLLRSPPRPGSLACFWETFSQNLPNHLPADSPAPHPSGSFESKPDVGSARVPKMPRK